MIVSYFKCSLSTGAAVLTAKHQKGLYTKNCLLLQLKYVWRRETQGTSCCYLNWSALLLTTLATSLANLFLDRK